MRLEVTQATRIAYVDIVNSARGQNVTCHNRAKPKKWPSATETYYREPPRAVQQSDALKEFAPVSPATAEAREVIKEAVLKQFEAHGR